MQMLWSLLESIGSWIAMAFLLRTYLEWVGIDSLDPIGQLVRALTDWAVLPLRKILPNKKQLDLPSLTASFCVSLLLSIFYVGMFWRGRLWTLSVVLALAVFWIVKWALWLASGIVLVRVILSWVNPLAPIAPTLNILSKKLLNPIQRAVPPIGGIDWSSAIFLVLIQVALSIWEIFLNLLAWF